MGYGLDHIIHGHLDRNTHSRLLLILTTEGGNAHATYRVARILQRTYEHVSVFVSGWCKSAGTLLAVCGHELIVGDRGELGPVDVQRGRPDDLWESTSGLTETAAVTTLEEIAWSLFRKLVTETKQLSAGQISFKAAADAAVPIVSGMLTPIFAQIDPLKLGENARALNIASEYARRLDEHSKNLATSVESLISEYPDHGFVIDRKEAERLFRIVEEPSAQLRELSTVLGETAVYPRDPDNPVLLFLNDERQDINNVTDRERHNAKQKETGVETDDSTGHADAGSTADGSMATQTNGG